MATSYGGDKVTLGLSASGDLNSIQYRFVQAASTAGYVEQATGGSGPAPIGVLQNDPNDGQAATVTVFGTTKVLSSTGCGNIGFRDWISSGSDGQAVLATGAGSNICGMALEANSTGSGVEIAAFVFLSPISGCGIQDNTP